MNGSSACWGDSGGNVPVACVDGAQEKVLAEYIWLGGSGTDLHSKSKVLDCKPTCVEDLPVVVVDGSSCGQAVADDYEVYLRPRKMYTDPFRGGDHLLVLCDVVVPPPVTADPAKKDVVQPHPSNNRAPCEAVMARAVHQQPVFAVEQEYTLMDPATSWPMGWPAKSFPEPARPYYGGAGTGVSMGRDFAEAHMQACLQAGVKLSGVCATATPGQWSYQVGPCQGIQLGDELWVSRYLLLRMSERYKIVASLDPKPIPGDWNGSGCYVKYSTAETRTAGTGLNAIQDHLQRLHSAHAQHMTAYGQGNTRRFSDKAPVDIKFTCGFSNKTCSVTIPRATLLNRGGYYSDRRPASNMDPYLVTMLLVSTTLGVPLPAGNEPVVLSFSKHSSKPSMSAFPCPSATSCYSGESSGANTEDVLIDELDRLDHQFAPDTPPNMYPSGLTYSESSDECSDGTSPEQRSPLALAMHQDEMYCC